MGWAAQVLSAVLEEAVVVGVFDGVGDPAAASPGWQAVITNVGHSVAIAIVALRML